MRVKTSITLSEHALAAVDRLAGKQSSRSRVIEAAIEAYVAERARATRDARDRAILDAIAPEVADEMLDVLSYQADV
ncbi:MAG: ribbon-helix-helix protein, CopG family [Polyangiaceae bacterium]|nr:ribbon-helix-helix protein, CopG family [Polyangiaceae bacterium]